MSRISNHNIDEKLTANLEPVPTRVRFYVDGYRAKLIGEDLWERGLRAFRDLLKEHIASGKLDEDAAGQTYARYARDKRYAVTARLLSFAIAYAELDVIDQLEAKSHRDGRPVFPNSYLVNISNPWELDGLEGNLIAALSGTQISDDQIAAAQYLDVTCDGKVFAPGKVNRGAEISKLKNRLETCPHDEQDLLRKNIDLIKQGCYQAETSRAPTNFGETEAFVDLLAQEIGKISQLGVYNIYRGYGGIKGLKEKGVDCDLIMAAMDDLHGDLVDTFVFLTHDGDFAPLLRRIKAEGKEVFLAGLSQSEKGRVSGRLQDAIKPNKLIDLSGDEFANLMVQVLMTDADPKAMSMMLQFNQVSKQAARKQHR